MPIRSRTDPKRNADYAELRSILGLNPTNALPDVPLTAEVQGYRVRLLTRAEAQRYVGPKRKPHRIYAECKLCGVEVPAGRLAQHEQCCVRAVGLRQAYESPFETE